MSAPEPTAMAQGLQSCEGCGLLSRPAPGAHEGRCPRCDEKLEFRKPVSLERTLAYLIAAAVCYVPANLLPVMQTITSGGSESDTIMQGVVLLWSPTGWPLSLIVLFASIMIPSAKIVALLYLVITVKRGSIRNNAQRVRMYRLVEIVGRWSMVDVFVDTFTVSLIQLQPLMSVEPGPGLLFFAAVVVLTMLAVESFDPRLIWDATSSKEIQKRFNMPDQDPSRAQVSESRVVAKKRTRLSLVWIIPIVAAVAGIWIAVTRILNQGPEITIVFQSAEGLQAGKTKIQYNGLNVGTLTAIRLADDRKKVVATARMDPKAKEFLVKDTQFWIVRPRMSGLNISGLGTLLSGHYIGVELGQSREHQRNFVALETPPIVARDTPGRFLMLRTSDLGSLSDAAPIYFRHIDVGEIVSHELDKSGQFMSIKAFVRAPYDQYVTPDTRFWQASGIDMSLSANGLQVQTESLMSILGGGIAFETPAAGSLLPSTETNAPYTLFRNRTEAFNPPARHPFTYLIIFKQSVRGLAVGAPVTMNGITVGEVTEIHAQFDAKTFEFTVPVTITVDGGRYGVKFVEAAAGETTIAGNKKAMDFLVSRGLRAQLKTGSLISGSLYVAVDFFPDAAQAEIDWAQNPPQLPTLPGSLEGIETSLASIMKKLDQMQFKEISDDLRKVLGDLDKTLVGAHGTLTNADTLLGNADKLLKNADKLVEPNSILLGELGGLLQEAGGAARGLRLLADYLERHPEALIRGKTGDAK